MPDEIVEVTEESWFGRLANSIKSVLVGIVLFIVAFPVLWWNEGRAVTTYRSLKEGAGAVVSVSADTVEAGNESKLVHISGQAVTDETLTDPVFAKSANALSLSRTVRMFQWKEREESRKEKKLGGGTKTVKITKYSTDWSESFIDSAAFKDPVEHENPPGMPYRSESQTAKNVTVGAFTLTGPLVKMVTGSTALSASEDDLPGLPADIRDRARVQNGEIYIGDDPAAPVVGDLRISFSVVEPKGVSVVAQQVGDTFQPFQTQAGKPIQLLKVGTLSAAEMFEAAQASNRQLTWILRLVGFGLMFIGLMLVFSPIAVFGDVIPLVGSLLSAGLGLFAGLIAVALSLVTIAIAWVAVRPLVGIPLLVVAVASVVLLAMKGKKQPA